MRRNGVHPLIATVFMILIVVATAYVIGEWLGPFTERQTEAVENRSETVHACAELRIRVLDAAYGDDMLNLTVINAGVRDADNVQTVILSSGRVIAQEPLGNLQQSAIRSMTFDTDGQTPEEIVVFPESCPMQRDEYSLE